MTIWQRRMEPIEPGVVIDTTTKPTTTTATTISQLSANVLRDSPSTTTTTTTTRNNKKQQEANGDADKNWNHRRIGLTSLFHFRLFLLLFPLPLPLPLDVLINKMEIHFYLLVPALPCQINAPVLWQTATSLVTFWSFIIYKSWPGSISWLSNLHTPPPPPPPPVPPSPILHIYEAANKSVMIIWKWIGAFVSYFTSFSAPPTLPPTSPPPVHQSR